MSDLGVLGSQLPRIRLVPEGVEHPRWSEFVEFTAALGLVLDPWQLETLRLALLRSDDRWAAFAVGVCVPRQNGKNGILEVRELGGAMLLGERLQIHSAHLADTSKEHFRRLDDLIDANEWLSREVKHIWRTNGHEAIEFRGGRRIRFRTRTRGGGRGFSGSPVYFDEAMFLPEVSMGAILPVLAAQPDPQVWYTGSAVDWQTMDDGHTFTRVRNRALAGDDPRLVYQEWSLEAGSPDLVDSESAGDPAIWSLANPAFGRRISEEYIRAERGELDPRTFAVERLGVGAWPAVDLDESEIDMELWAAAEDRESKPLDPVCFAFDMSPRRSLVSIVAAGLRSDGLPHIEVIDRRDGTGWVAERLLELSLKHRPSAIGYATSSPAESLLPDIERLKIRDVVAVTTAEHGAACGRMFDMIEQGSFRHMGDASQFGQALTQAVAGAVRKPMGDKFLWSRSQSKADITAFVAATLAMYLLSLHAGQRRVPMVAFG